MCTLYDISTSTKLHHVCQNVISTCFFQAHMPSYVLAWVNPVIAPWVYVTFNIQYRKAFIDSLKWLKILKKTDYL